MASMTTDRVGGGHRVEVTAAREDPPMATYHDLKGKVVFRMCYLPLSLP